MTGSADIGLLVLRVVLGLTMAAHGAQKLFGWFGGRGFQGTLGMIRSLGLRLPILWVAAIYLGEFGGGGLLTLGLLTPIAAALIIATMTVAVAKVHFHKGFWNSQGGFEFNLLIAASAAAIGLTGPGAFSLDAAAGLQGVAAGPAAFLLALVIAVAVAVVAIVASSRPSTAQ